MQLVQIDCFSKNASQLFTHSLREIGFAVLQNYSISQELIQSTYGDWARFFSNAEKLKYQRNSMAYDGYLPFSGLVERFQALPDTPLPDSVKSSTCKIREELLKLGDLLLKWVEDSIPCFIKDRFSMPLVEMVNGSSQTMLRVIHYPPSNIEPDEKCLRAGEHTDPNLITLLPAPTSAGLEIRDRDGFWQHVSHDSGAIIVNAGDMLQFISHGYFRSIFHRVIRKSGPLSQTSRYSMPLFIHPRPEVRLTGRITAQKFMKGFSLLGKQDNLRG